MEELLHKYPEVHHLSDYGKPSHLCRKFHMEVDIQEGRTLVRSLGSYEIHPDLPHSEALPALFLNGEGLELKELRVDGHNHENYQSGPLGLLVQGLPAQFELETLCEIHPEKNTALEGLYLSGNLYCTQCEPEGFRRITYAIDRPDNLAIFTCHIEADKGRFPVLLSNGNLVDSGQTGDRHWVLWSDPFPKPTYLFALVAGDLAVLEDSFTTKSGRTIQLRLFVDPGNEHKGPWALQSLKKAMAWDEQRYGLEYDLDIFMIVAVRAFNMGAMENKGLNIFNASTALAAPETSTDGAFLRIQEVVAHEYFHNWTGNRVTCRDWFQLTLKEGLTVLRDQQFSEDTNGFAQERLDSALGIINHQFLEDAGPLSHPIQPASYQEINNFYTSTVYQKGAEVIRMLHTLLGEAVYQRGISDYLQTNDGRAATTEDFLAAMERASGRDLRDFRRWYHQSGTPVLHVTATHDREKSRYRLEILQENPPTADQEQKEALWFPFRLALLNKKDGRELTEATIVVEGRKCVWEQPLEPGQEVLPSLNRGFSAPVKVLFPYSQEDRLFLLAHDQDPVNRQLASQEWWIQTLLDLYRSGLGNIAQIRLPQEILDVHKKLLADTEQDPGFLVGLLSLPPLSQVNHRLEYLDHEGLYRLYKAVRLQLAQGLENTLWSRYQECQEALEKLHQDAPPLFDLRAVGPRGLKQLCLSRLSELDTHQSREVLWKVFQEAGTFSDEIVSLSILVKVDHPRAQEALELFHQKWNKDQQVLDSWFGVQASNPQPGALERVQKLLEHPEFTWKVPNRVRAVLGSFLGGAVHEFHRADGRGYDFLQSMVLVLDPLNPQICARILKMSLMEFTRLDPERRKALGHRLERLLEVSELSADSREVLQKTLAGR